MQADAGAQVVQIFDSWASELSPQDFDIFSAPYIKQIISDVRKVTLHFLPPDLPSMAPAVRLSIHHACQMQPVVHMDTSLARQPLCLQQRCCMSKRHIIAHASCERLGQASIICIDADTSGPENHPLH